MPVQQFARPSRLTVPSTPQVSHVPVMVSVPKTFSGDSIIVKSEDLSKLGITRALVETPIQEETAAAPEPVAQIENESPVAPLSQVDDSFVLTDSVAQVTETLDLNEAEPTVLTPEVESPIPVEPVADTTIIQQQPGPVSPFDTETFRAYNDFLNTWLKLASVNLNRPDLLNLVNNHGNPTTTAPIAAVRESLPAIVPEEVVEPEVIQAEVVMPLEPEVVDSETIVPVVSDIIEPNVVEEFIEPDVTDVVEPIPADAVEVPVDISVAPVEAAPETIEAVITDSDDVESSLVETTESEIISATTEEPVVLDAVTENQPQTEIIEEAPVDSVKEIPVEEEIIITEASPAEPVEVVTEAIPVVKKADTAVDLAPGPNVLPELTPDIISTNSIAKAINTQNVQPENNFFQAPALLEPVPRFTSRGRFSGYRYSFSHVPQRATFFLHNQAV